MVADAMDVDDDVGGVCLDKNAFQKCDHALKVRAMASLAQVCGSLFVSAVLTIVGRSVQASPPPQAEWRIALEASFFKPAVRVAVPEAKKTFLTAGIYRDGEFTGFTKQEWEEFAIDWDAFAAVARRNAERDWESLEIRFKRDRREVVQYAEIISRNGTAGCCVVTEAFGPRFFETMGESFLFAIPSRQQCFVLPKLAGNPAVYSDMVHSAYRASSNPISVELFEWDKGVIKAVGMFERP
jgi:hypothetical protein